MNKLDIANQKLSYFCDKKTNTYHISYPYEDILSQHNAEMKNIKNNYDTKEEDFDAPKHNKYKVIRLVEKYSMDELTLHKKTEEKLKKLMEHRTSFNYSRPRSRRSYLDTYMLKQI